MSRYLVNIPSTTDLSFDGGVTIANYAKCIDCMGMYHGMDLSVVQTGTNRTDGDCVHGRVVMAHKFDKASPTLRKAAAQRANLGTVTIHRVTTVTSESGTASTASLETITIRNARCVAVVMDSPVRPDGTDVQDEMIEYFALEYDTEITWDYRDAANNTSLAARTVALVEE